MIQFKATKKGTTEELTGDLIHINNRSYLLPVGHIEGGEIVSIKDFEVDPDSVQMDSGNIEVNPPELLSIGKIWDGNITCSEFIGPSRPFNDQKKGKITLYFSEDFTAGALCELNELKFHSSPKWIWPVWEKFRSREIKGEEAIMEHHDHCCDFLQAVMGGNVRHLFEVLVKGITWYKRYVHNSIAPAKLRKVEDGE